MKYSTMTIFAIAAITQAVYVEDEDNSFQENELAEYMDFDEIQLAQNDDDEIDISDLDEATFLQMEAALLLDEAAGELDPLGTNLAQVGSGKTCWKRKYRRGGGKRPELCPEGMTLIDRECREDCKEGFVFHRRSDRCVKKCPTGFTDKGANCYRNRGTPDICPEGMTKNGKKLCWKGGDYAIRDPQEPSCEPGAYKHAHGRHLCYQTCPNDWHPMRGDCWQRCPAGTKNCGLLCITESEKCWKKIVGMVFGVVSVLPTTLPTNPLDVINAAKKFAELGKVFGYPKCDHQAISWEWDPPKDANGDGQVDYWEDQNYWQSNL